MQAERHLFPVMDVDLGSGDGRLALADVRWRLVLQGFEDGLDVLAGAERVGLEVGTGAGVVASVKAANGDGVRAAGRRVGDVEVAEDALAASVLDAEPAGASALAAE